MRAFWIFMRVLNFLLWPIVIGQILLTFSVTQQAGVAIISGVFTGVIIKVFYWIIEAFVSEKK